MGESIPRRHPIDDEHAGEMIELVLPDAGGEVVVTQFEPLAVESGRHDGRDLRAADRDPHVRNAEAALLERHEFALEPDLGVDEDLRVGLLGQPGVRHEQPTRDPDLRCREADPVRLVHRLDHGLHESVKVVIDRLDRLGTPSKHRMGIAMDLERSMSHVNRFGGETRSPASSGIEDPKPDGSRIGRTRRLTRFGIDPIPAARVPWTIPARPVGRVDRRQVGDATAAPRRIEERRVALFGKKKKTDDQSEAAASAGWQPEPHKAAKFFEHARTAAQTGNYSYAIELFARGLKFDPSNMEAHQALYEAGIRYLQSGGKPAASKEVKAIDGPNPADRMAAYEFAWAKDLNNLAIAFKLMQAIARVDEKEFGQWLAPRIFAMMTKAKKQAKTMWIQGKDLFVEVDAWKEAFAAAEKAIAIDPSDTELISELNELSAQRAMSEGGFNQSRGGEAGDFRRLIRNADQQAALEDENSLAGGASAERAMERAKAEFEANPESPEAVNKYAQLLRRNDTAEEDATAVEVYMKGFEATGQYRFRMAAGDVRMGRMAKRLRKLEESEAGGEEATALKAELLALRADEYGERVAKYPTDRGIKFELGLIEYERGNYEDAMAMFQQCKDEAKYRTRATHMLGKCFSHEGWHQEAVGEFREALEHTDGAEKEREMPIRYDLMLSLIDLARESNSMEEAREAAEICSAIVRKDIGYRDIRVKRKEVDALIKELGG